MLFVFALVLTFSVAQQLPTTFPDADTYYHGHIAQLTLTSNDVVREYPWFVFSEWREGFVDGHFGYHLWLVPFVGLWGVETGMRVSAVIGALLAFLTLYYFLRKIDRPSAIWLIYLATLTTEFVWRMSLPRAPSLAVVMMLPFLFAADSHRWRLVGLYSFIFCFVYHGWPVLTLILAGVLAVGFVIERRRFLKQAIIGVSWHATGIILGYLINPYFPRNLHFALTDIFVLGLSSNPNVRAGGEWLPPTDQGFAKMTIWPTLIAIATLIIVIIAGKTKRRDLINTQAANRTLATLGVLSLLFLLLSIRSQRYVEYLTPVALLTVARLLSLTRPFFNTLRRAMHADRLSRIVWQALVMVLIILPWSTAPKLQIFNTAPRAGQSADELRPALNALAKALPEGSIIYHNRWDDGPTLAFAEPRFRYILGLDTGFMAIYDPKAYESWAALSEGSSASAPRDIAALSARGAIVRAFGQTQAGEATVTKQLDQLPGSRRVYDTPQTVAIVWD